MIRDDLEILTHRIVRGDITPVVYDLIKESPFIGDIYLGEELKYADKECGSRTADDESFRGVDFKSWLSDNVQPVATDRTDELPKSGFRRVHNERNSKKFHSKSK